MDSSNEDRQKHPPNDDIWEKGYRGRPAHTVEVSSHYGYLSLIKLVKVSKYRLHLESIPE
jgi:hypothetical protein